MDDQILPGYPVGGVDETYIGGKEEGHPGRKIEKKAIGFIALRRC